ILSPANYMEFKRVLAPEGIIVKIVPRPNYLKELREVIFTNSDKKAYTNGETISLFKKNFQLVNNFRFSYFKELEQTEILNIIQKSPLACNAEKKQIDYFLYLNLSVININFILY